MWFVFVCFQTISWSCPSIGWTVVMFGIAVTWRFGANNSFSYFYFLFYIFLYSRLRQPGCLGESTSFSGWDRIGKSRSSQICWSHLVVRALYFSTQTSWSRILPDCYIWQIWSKELTFIFCRKIDCWIWLIITLCLWPCVVVFIKQSFGSHSSETFP